METDFYEQISSPLARLEEGFHFILQSAEPFVQEINTYLVHTPGKRIRPALFFLAMGLWSKQYEEHLPVAIALELIHTATLVHDDVVDQADKRRGYPTVSNKWGNHVSVLAGDYLFAKAFTLLTEYGSLPLIREMARLVEEMTEGEIQQQAERFMLNISQDDYLKRITKKTARFFIVASRAGGIVTGAAEEDIHLLEEYGYHAGIAFQIIDDFLDFSGDAQTTGKPAATDLRQGIITLPVLHVLENSGQRDVFRERISLGDVDSRLIEEICQEMKICHTPEFVRALAGRYVSAAKQALAGLPANNYQKTLHDVAEFILRRNF